jgi:hypothetical protein
MKCSAGIFPQILAAKQEQAGFARRKRLIAVPALGDLPFFSERYMVTRNLKK